ncbi:hypothetical protein EHE19_001870 [Ruminiclostridium herbifermentans]|uniref:Uncharacterized protein n=1 Tax=Ruminiclostridium herbifermentans TaxID=2488810 RepID=A0A7H1VPK1_9FIRM|nr:hypothetical protein [Ruminiclostridium herbifermentans]QNU67313.1 hypothetical protein EHE19_001870 [Ruminiclostridium herbifermentans]
MLYDTTDKDNIIDRKMERVLSEIINILTYSEKVDKKNNENISDVIDNIMMNYLWRKK